MIRSDFHMHSTYCDGKNTLEEMVQSALAKGFTCIGFSGHSYTDFDESYCMSKENTYRYFEEVHALQKKYQDQIEILCGIEQDMFAGKPSDTFPDLHFDYVIGSVHYVRAGGALHPVDEGPETFDSIVNTYFGGDYFAFAEQFYADAAAVADLTGCTFIGHFDLITKYNEGGVRFDESDPRYIRAYKKALDRLLLTGCPFEINTGAITRGYRKTPYPSMPILHYLAAKGAKVILSSDSHRTESIGYGFDRLEEIVKALDMTLLTRPI